MMYVFTCFNSRAAHEKWGESIKEYQCVDVSEDMNSLAEFLLRGKKLCLIVSLNPSGWLARWLAGWLAGQLTICWKCLNKRFNSIISRR